MLSQSQWNVLHTCTCKWNSPQEIPMTYASQHKLHSYTTCSCTYGPFTHRQYYCGSNYKQAYEWSTGVANLHVLNNISWVPLNAHNFVPCISCSSHFVISTLQSTHCSIFNSWALLNASFLLLTYMQHTTQIYQMSIHQYLNCPWFRAVEWNDDRKLCNEVTAHSWHKSSQKREP